MNRKNNFIVGLCFFAVIWMQGLNAQSFPERLSEKMAQSVPHTLWQKYDGFYPKWTYEQGVVLKGVNDVWKNTDKVQYFNYIKNYIDFLLEDDGTIKTYKKQDYNIDNINTGKTLLLLYRITGKQKYYNALSTLRKQMLTHPRTKEGGFWHKKRYPWQMWLDGLYMAQPFLAEYASVFGEKELFDDIAKQFVIMEKHARDPKTGLLYHGYDESREQKWADAETGLSPNFWGRAMGWYAMALVDSWEHFPEDHPGKDELKAIFNRLMVAVADYRDPESGLWLQVVDKIGGEGNYPESSASSMFIYAMAKGARLGLIAQKYQLIAQDAYTDLVKKYISKTPDGWYHLGGTVKVSGLGGNPYRDASYEYYLSEPVISDDPKGVGAFIMAANEIEMIPTLKKGKGLTVTLDRYFNNEWRGSPNGIPIPDHYVWTQLSNGGFSLLAYLFNSYGAQTGICLSAPTKQRFKNTDIYIIVDPDTEKETDKPNYIEQKDIKILENWVKKGGILLLMANDKGNAEFTHFNQLASRFGITFNEDSNNRVQGREFEQGAVDIPPNHLLFTKAQKVYIKEYASLNCTQPAEPILKDGDNVIAAIAHYGKGTVLAIGDPWLYNEYVDGRKLPADFQNHLAAQEMVKWLVGQANN